MGIFNKRAIASLGEKQGLFDSWIPLIDGRVAKSYLKPIIAEISIEDQTIISRMSLNDLEEHITDGSLSQYISNQLKSENPVLLKPLSAGYFSYNPVTQEITAGADTFKIETVNSFEFIRDGNVSKRFGYGSAAAGVILTGGVGVLAGFLLPKKKNVVNDFRVRIYTTGETSIHDASLIYGKTKVDSFSYRLANSNAEEISEFLQNYLLNRDTYETAYHTSAIADELKKLAELRDTNILTPEEFEYQKNKLLNE